MNNNLHHIINATNLKSLFLLDPDVIFLNHGSFGATPRPVFEEYRRWQEALERQPVQFLANDLEDHLVSARADFYLGNAHKWLCSPKGSGFLYARRDQQHLIEPLVVGWGWGEERTINYGSDYLDYLQWLGTNDLSAYLAVPAAIRFQEEYDWTAVRRRCHDLLQKAVQRICALTGLESLYSGTGRSFHQMAIAPLPRISDLTALKTRLYEEYRVEVPLIEWEDRHFIRISV